MMYFSVTFQYSESTYCSNLAMAECREDVEAYYSDYAWFSISEATEGDIREAERKGKPVIICPHVTDEEPRIIDWIYGEEDGTVIINGVTYEYFLNLSPACEDEDCASVVIDGTRYILDEPNDIQHII